MKSLKPKLPVIVSGFKESVVNVVEENQNGKLIIRGLAVPFGKVSSNGVLYNRESLIETLEVWKDCPVMYNHQIEGDALPIGKILSMNAKDDGLHYEVEIDSEEKKICQKIRDGYLKKVSIHIMPKDVVVKSGYQEAMVMRPLEFSLVPIPGFMETDMEAYIERLKMDNKSEGDKQMAKIQTTTTALKTKPISSTRKIALREKLDVLSEKAKMEKDRQSLITEFKRLKESLTKTYASKTDVKNVLTLVEELIDKEEESDIVGEVNNHESALKDAAEVLEAVLNRLDRIEEKIEQLHSEEQEVVIEEMGDEEDNEESQEQEAETEEPQQEDEESEVEDEEDTEEETEDEDKEEKVKCESKFESMTFIDLERKDFQKNLLHLK